MADSRIDLSPRQDASAKLLLLLARSTATSDQLALGRSLAAQVNDWVELVGLAERKFAATYLYKHLSVCAADVMPRDAMAALRMSSNSTGLAVLRNVAAVANFHKACIETTGVAHAYLKGVALSRQFSMPVNERYSRDVDVLIESRGFERVLTAAATAGYQILLSTDPVTPTRDKHDLAFLARYADVVTLLGHDGVAVEVHRQLEKLSLNFGVANLLKTAETVELSGLRLQTLARPVHFVYAAYHHARHFWSRLHWLADLDGMQRSIDRQQVRHVAAQIGIEPAIEATFDFHRLAGDPASWSEDAVRATYGGQYLNACLINLRGDLEVEQVLRARMTLNEFMGEWQISPGQYNRLWMQSWFHRLRPSVTQYNERRLPPLLHWVYFLESAASLAKNAGLIASRGMMRAGRKLFAASRSQRGF